MTRLLALAVVLASSVGHADPPARPKVDLVQALVDAGDWRKHDPPPPPPQSYVVTIDRNGLHGPRGKLHGMAAAAMFASGLALVAAHAEHPEGGGCDGPICAIAIGLAVVAATIETAASKDE